MKITKTVRKSNARDRSNMSLSICLDFQTPIHMSLTLHIISIHYMPDHVIHNGLNRFNLNLQKNPFDLTMICGKI